MKDFNSKLVLITGGSSGMGLELAKKLAGEGAHVFILARRPDHTCTALEEIKHRSVNPGQRFGCILGDVTQAGEIQQKLTDWMVKEGTPDLLINAAGAARPAVIEDTSLDIFHHQMDLHYFGIVHTVQVVLPGMLQRGSGCIVNFSSAGGFIGIHGFSAYCASKFAVRGYTDSLRAEMKPRGIQVAIVFPPDTDTPGLVEENLTKPAVTYEFTKTAKLETPEHVADIVIRGIRRGSYAILPGFVNEVLFMLFHKLGRWVYPVIDFLLQDARQKVEKRERALNANSPK
jgi:3-dehydrosphinganine reductase